MARFASQALFATLFLSAVVPPTGARALAPGTLRDILESTPQFSIFSSAVNLAGVGPLLSRAGMKTLFVPSNDAFLNLGNTTLSWLTHSRNSQLLLALVLNHIVPGPVSTSYLAYFSTLTTLNKDANGVAQTLRVAKKPSGWYAIDDALLLSQDGLSASNGLIQMIDKVLLPANLGLPTKDALQTVLDMPMFTTLAKAFITAGLADLLSQPNGPFTIFAPLNTAFDALPLDVSSCLLTNPPALRTVLQAHVIRGEELYSSDIADGTVVRTLQDSLITLTFDGPTISAAFHTAIPASRVVLADVDSSNGVLHVIDRVMFDNTGPCARIRVSDDDRP